jgi:hypothetical protein
MSLITLKDYINSILSYPALNCPELRSIYNAAPNAGIPMNRKN